MIHVYHGDGKGKTTAAMGLVLRAAAAGWRVVVVQFLKGRRSGEAAAMDGLPGVTVLRGKSSPKFSFQMDDEERAHAYKAHTENLRQARGLVEEGSCELLVLDEALGALAKGLLDEDEVRELLACAVSDGSDRSEGDGELELVVTGRGLPDFIEEAADYITEMKCVRHPYQRGIKARKGVEY